MKPSVGACREAAGGTRTAPPGRSAAYALLGFMLVVFGLTVVTILVATNLVGRFAARNQQKEERKLEDIRRAFLESIARTQSIPTYTNWLTSLTPFANLDQTGLSQAHPEWGTDSTLSRAFLVDTNLPATLLPYNQPAAGLAGGATNLLGTAARVMIVSSTKRGLALPFSSGVVSSNSFNDVWNWVYDPVGKAPPSGWPAAWSRSGDFLHVERINLASLFHRIDCTNLIYGTAGPASVTNIVSTPTSFRFLRGTPLVMASLNGIIKRAYVVTRDAGFNLRSGPDVYYEFLSTNGPLSTNSGLFGSSADGLHTNGVILGVAGPRSPAFPNYPSTNTAISLDGVDDYVAGTNGLLNNLSSFTIASWFYPSAGSLRNIDLFGQRDIAVVGFTTPAGNLAFECYGGAKKLNYAYPYGVGSWHHVAGVMDGVNMLIYVDGIPVASRVDPTGLTGTNASPFNVGAKISANGGNFPGLIDEVVVYTRALSASQIWQLYSNSPP